MLDLNRSTPYKKVKPFQNPRKVTGWVQPIKIPKAVEDQPIEVDVGSRAKTCGEKTPEMRPILTGNKVYRLPLPPTYKEK